jgi:UDP-N-acetylglucosamine acyltransferase
MSKKTDLIHKSAEIHKTAKIGKNVSIGANVVIGENVAIGAGSVIEPNVVIDKNVVMGKKNNILPGASIGSPPQDLRCKGKNTKVTIGDNNTIREFVTINRATERGGRITSIGNNNLIMAYVHIAHDCRIGNHVVMENLATLGGHVTIYDRAIIGGMVGIHPFVSVGEITIIGGCSKIVQDIPPYMTADGNPIKVRGLNVIGLRRNNISLERRNALKRAYRILYRSGFRTSKALKLLGKEKSTPELKTLINFIKLTIKGKLGRANEAHRND